jgi:hypothetical protein
MNISMMSADIMVQHAKILLGGKNQQHDADRHSLSLCAMFKVAQACAYAEQQPMKT